MTTVIPFATKPRLVRCDGCGDMLLSSEIGYHICRRCHREIDEHIAAKMATDPDYQAWVKEQEEASRVCPF